MKFHAPWVKYVYLRGQNINNNYYSYEHYLANIALNLEVCFNLYEFYNIPKTHIAEVVDIAIILLGLYSVHM